MKTLSQNTNTTETKSTDTLHHMMQDILTRARRCGATDAFTSINNDNGFSVDVRMGEVETVAFNEDQGVSVTVYVGQRKGSASSTDTSEAALDAMVSAAYDIALVSAEDPCFGLPDKDLVQTTYPDLNLYYPWNVTPEEAIEMALTCEKEALNIDKRIVNSDGVNVSTHTYSRGYATTQGASGIIQTTRHSLSCSLIAKSLENMQRDYDYCVTREASHLIAPELLARSAVERAVSRLDSRRIKTQKTPVIFSSRLSSGLFSALIAAISGSNLYRKHSFLLDAMGQQIFPAHVSIYEQPHLLKGLGSAPFDDEGVATRANLLVKDGVLCQYVLGSYSARRLGLKTTANAGGVHNLTIDTPTLGLPELFKQMSTGLFVTELMGEGGNILTGDYSRGAAGFWIENGIIQYPVEEITIAGNLRDMFLGIVGMANDLNPNIATRCGSVLINEMMVGGE